MKYITFPFLLITLLITGSYSNWYFQTSGTTVTLNSVYFASADVGFICGKQRGDTENYKQGRKLANADLRYNRQFVLRAFYKYKYGFCLW